MMALQKVRPTVLPSFFKTSTYFMYAFILEKKSPPCRTKFLLSHSISFLRSLDDE